MTPRGCSVAGVLGVGGVGGPAQGGIMTPRSCSMDDVVVPHGCSVADVVPHGCSVAYRNLDPRGPHPDLDPPATWL